MSHHRAAPAVTAALDRARDNEIVFVRGVDVSTIRFEDLEPVMKRAFKDAGIAPQPWPVRWLIEDDEGAISVHEFVARSDRNVG